MKKVLITGTTGMLGKDILKVFSNNSMFDVYTLNIEPDKNSKNDIILDITEYALVTNTLKKYNFDLIIHAAALVNVDFCEKHHDIADAVNVKATINLSKLCKKFVFISTDSVYEGKVGCYKETQNKKPSNYYAKTKSVAEDEIIAYCNDYLILRTNIYGFHNTNGYSLFEWAYSNLEKNIPIKGFDDVWFNPIYTMQLSEFIIDLVKRNSSGIFNIGAESPITKFDFILEVCERFGFDKKIVKPISIDNGGLTAERPKKTTMNIDKLYRETCKKVTIKEGISSLYEDYSERLRGEKDV